LKGASNGTEGLHAGAGDRDVAGSRGAAEPRREDRQDLSGLGISEQSYYRWRRLYGGLKVDQARRLKDLERENQRLKKAVSELTLDKLILKEALEGKY
jgi:putative transposase